MSDRKDIKNEYDLNEHIIRVTAALYRVTDILMDAEPLKWSLRQTAMNIFDYFSNAENSADSVRKNHIRHCRDIIVVLQNKILLAEAGGFMSHINFEVLGREYRLIYGKLIAIESGSVGQVLRLEDIALSKANTPTITGILPRATETDRSSQLPPLQPTEQRANKPPSRQKNEHSRSALSASRVKDRKQLILTSLKPGQWLGLADIWQFFKGAVSEKTIQRDLNSLYLQGMLAIEGDKRWRRYVLLSEKDMSDKSSPGKVPQDPVVD